MADVVDTLVCKIYCQAKVVGMQKALARKIQLWCCWYVNNHHGVEHIMCAIEIRPDKIGKNLVLRVQCALCTAMRL